MPMTRITSTDSALAVGCLHAWGVTFREVAGTTVDEVVATFLAVLELFRRGLIDVEQEAPFGDLTLLPRAG